MDDFQFPERRYQRFDTIKSFEARLTANTQLVPILDRICSDRGVTIGQILGKSRNPPICAARGDLVVELWRAGLTSTEIDYLTGLHESRVRAIVRKFTTASQ